MNHSGTIDKWYICFKFQGIWLKESGKSNLYYSNDTHTDHTTPHSPQYARLNYFIWDRWNNPNENSGIQLMTIHLLRHSFFCLCLRKRCNLARALWCITFETGMYHLLKEKDHTFVATDGTISITVHEQSDWHEKQHQCTESSNLLCFCSHVKWK